MMNNARFRSVIVGGSIVVTAAGVFTSAAVATASGATDEPPRPAVVRQFDTSVFDLDLLTARPSKADKLPASIAPVDLGSQGVQASSVRLIETKNGVNYYLSVGIAPEVCLTIVLHDQVAATGCSSPERFAEQALGVRAIGPDAIAEAYLVPDKVAKTGVPNLLIENPLGVTSARSHAIAAPNGYDLGLLPAVSDAELPPALKARAAGE